MIASPTARRFIGVWRLEEIRDRLPDGRVVDHPDFGSTPDGFLFYTESGHVSVQLMRRGRPPWRSEDDPPDAERAEAARGYGAYAGRFELDEGAGVVLHHVETALIPNRIGRTLKRLFSFSGDRLVLRPPTFLRDGTEIERTLTWKRT